MLYSLQEMQERVIEGKIQEICANIAKRGMDSHFSAIFDLLFEHIEDNLEKFLPEVCND